MAEALVVASKALKVPLRLAVVASEEQMVSALAIPIDGWKNALLRKASREPAGGPAA